MNNDNNQQKENNNEKDNQAFSYLDNINKSVQAITEVFDKRYKAIPGIVTENLKSFNDSLKIQNDYQLSQMAEATQAITSAFNSYNIVNNELPEIVVASYSRIIEALQPQTDVINSLSNALSESLAKPLINFEEVSQVISQITNPLERFANLKEITNDTFEEIKVTVDSIEDESADELKEILHEVKDTTRLGKDKDMIIEELEQQLESEEALRKTAEEKAEKAGREKNVDVAVKNLYLALEYAEKEGLTFEYLSPESLIEFVEQTTVIYELFLLLF